MLYVLKLRMSLPQAFPHLTHAEKRLMDLKRKFNEIDKNFTDFIKIGEGTFSTVYQGKLIKDKNLSLAFKVLVATSAPLRVEKEIQILKLLKGEHNIISLYACMRCQDTYVIVMPNFPHQKFQTFYRTLTPKGTCQYLTGLLKALAYIHKFNIIHRDIKPSNFLFDRLTGKCRLVDFGLAQFEELELDNNDENEEYNYLKQYTEKRGLKFQETSIICVVNHKMNEICSICMSRPVQHTSRAGTPGFRSPEVNYKLTYNSVSIYNFISNSEVNFPHFYIHKHWFIKINLKFKLNFTTLVLVRLCLNLARH